MLLLRASLAMTAFAGNSILCRLALKETSIDAASFTLIRLVSGALVLALLVLWRGGFRQGAGSWSGGLALTVYAVAFSFAYLHLDAGTGALLLFGAVQLSMIAWGMWRGERLNGMSVTGVALACGGIVLLLLPGASSPPLGFAALMVLAGLAWGVYSLLGRGTKAPELDTAGNFARAVPIAALSCLAMLSTMRWDALGVTYAVVSGGLASGAGYVLWYGVVRQLSAIGAGVVQLSVPCLASLAGFLFLGEALTLRLVSATAMVLGGIAVVLRVRQLRQTS